jgi:ribosome biogenesis protein Nip4
VTSHKQSIKAIVTNRYAKIQSFVRHTQREEKIKHFASYLGNKQVYVQKIKPSYENVRCLAHSSKHKTYARREAW